MSQKRKYNRVNYKRFYRGKYFIAFYDAHGEHMVASYDNLRELVGKGQKKPLTQYNLNVANVELYRALRRPSHKTFMLNGELLTVWIFDVNEEDVDESAKAGKEKKQ